MAGINFAAPGLWLGIMSLIGTITTATGHPALGAVIGNPETASTMTTIASGIMALIAGISHGIAQPPAHK